MGILGAAALAILVAGCYSPSVRDCTVMCSNPSDCASGQVCGGDGMCAAPDVAGHCEIADVPDAAMPPPPPPDGAGPHVIIHVRIMGNGTVTVNQTLCNDKGPMGNDCMISVPEGVAATIHAATDGDPFQMWTSLACAGQGATCVITPLVPVTDVSARFMK